MKTFIFKKREEENLILKLIKGQRTFDQQNTSNYKSMNNIHVRICIGHWKKLL